MQSRRSPARPRSPSIPNASPARPTAIPKSGSVGLTETQAREAGYNLKIGKFPFTANSRASIVGQHEGFIKIVADSDYGEILGVHIIGPQATELIAEAVAAMEMEATVEDLMWTIHAHPTSGRSHAGRIQQCLRNGDQRLKRDWESRNWEIESIE